MAKKKVAEMTEDVLLYKITVGTDVFRDRHNPKRVRVQRLAKDYALVEWRGSSYSCRGHRNYVPGQLELYRIPVDARLSGGFNLWDCTRGNSLTKDRLAKIIELVEQQPLPADSDAYHALCRRIRDELTALRKPE